MNKTKSTLIDLLQPHREWEFNPHVHKAGLRKKPKPQEVRKGGTWRRRGCFLCGSAMVSWRKEVVMQWGLDEWGHVWGMMGRVGAGRTRHSWQDSTGSDWGRPGDHRPEQLRRVPSGGPGGQYGELKGILKESGDQPVWSNTTQPPQWPGGKILCLWTKQFNVG